VNRYTARNPLRPWSLLLVVVAGHEGEPETRIE